MNLHATRITLAIVYQRTELLASYVSDTQQRPPLLYQGRLPGARNG